MKDESEADYYFLVVMLLLFAWFTNQYWLMGIPVLVWLGDAFNLN